INIKPVDPATLLPDLKAHSAENTRHGDFMQTVFEVTFDRNTRTFSASYQGDTAALQKAIEGIAAEEKAKGEGVEGAPTAEKEKGGERLSKRARLGSGAEAMN
ncbi:hypothetical protein TeGR_g7535, partial [Tetraparma gracilis]